MCCNSWGRKESDTTERLNRTFPRATCIYKKFVDGIIHKVAGR